MNGQYGITKNTDSQSDNEVIEMLNWEKLFQKKKNIHNQLKLSMKQYSILSVMTFQTNV